MAAPLKVAAACRGILIGMGDCISVWPYIFAGAIIPLFAALWSVGQVVGGIVGAQVLIRIKSGSIRLLLFGGRALGGSTGEIFARKTASDRLDVGRFADRDPDPSVIAGRVSSLKRGYASITGQGARAIRVSTGEPKNRLTHLGRFVRVVMMTSG